jgi:hypothetical protein
MTKKQTKNKKDNKAIEQQLETKRKEELNMTKTLDEIQMNLKHYYQIIRMKSTQLLKN